MFDGIIVTNNHGSAQHTHCSATLVNDGWVTAIRVFVCLAKLITAK